MGNTHFSSYVFSYLFAQGLPIVAFVTSPDKPAGRGLHLKSTPVKQLALQLNVPVIETDLLQDEKLIFQLHSFQPDLFIVIAFKKLPEALLKVPQDGAINLHMSLLPNYRGAAPIHWAIIRGEQKTGLTTFILNNKIDAGDIIHQMEIPIEFHDTHDTLEEKMISFSGQFMIDSLNKFYSFNFKPLPQANNPDLPRAPKLTKDNTRINWNQPSISIYNFVRGLYSKPMAWTTLMTDKLSTPWYFKIHETRPFDGSINFSDEAGTIILHHRKRILVCTSSEPLEILFLQPEGKKRMSADEFIRGYENYLNHAKFA
ncbi:MAG: methionyl-tRNA formyltransferase [Bacteroidales bacterium]|nr:methionyl-tRNA formyltransferase [Bacteroidales bacterium]